MPRKKSSEVSTASPSLATGALRVKCPACQSEISSDGGTLHKLSSYLEELIEAGASLAEIEKAFEAMEAKYKQSQARVLELENEKEKTKNAKPVQETGRTKSDDWW